MAARPEVLEAVTTAREARQRVRRVIRKLMRHWDLHDANLADAFGVSRQAMNYRLTGRTAIAPEEEAGFAAFFGVPTSDWSRLGGRPEATDPHPLDEVEGPPW